MSELHFCVVHSLHLLQMKFLLMWNITCIAQQGYSS